MAIRLTAPQRAFLERACARFVAGQVPEIAKTPLIGLGTGRSSTWAVWGDTPQGNITMSERQGGDLEPVVFKRVGRIHATSGDVAAFFAKRHGHLLRDADNLLKSLTPQK